MPFQCQRETGTPPCSGVTASAGVCAAGQALIWPGAGYGTVSRCTVVSASPSSSPSVSDSLSLAPFPPPALSPTNGTGRTAAGPSQARHTGTVMHVTAHPDDENNALMAKQSQGQGLRVILATATRGNGGQNEIGPELFEALGVLRTEELRAAHRFDGAEQMFARAIDFGYSFSVDETFGKWGKDEILGDYVRLIRMTRPDVMIDDASGSARRRAAPSASALIGLEAFRAAADPNRYPEQLKRACGRGRRRRSTRSATTASSAASRRRRPIRSSWPLRPMFTTRSSAAPTPRSGARRGGCTSARASASCSHCPDRFSVKDLLVDTRSPRSERRDERDLLDGVDLSIPGLARFAGANPPARLVAAPADC